MVNDHKGLVNYYLQIMSNKWHRDLCEIILCLFTIGCTNRLATGELEFGVKEIVIRQYEKTAGCIAAGGPIFRSE